MESDRGRYRITITRVNARTPTIDHALHYDGKGDEVFVEAFAGEVTADAPADGTPPPIQYRRTKVMGDTHNLRGRIRAGNFSDAGGFKAGDTYPEGNFEREPTSDNLPLLVWEEELRDGQNGVLFMPAIWEFDNTTGALVPAWRLRFDRWWQRMVPVFREQVRGAPRESARAEGVDLTREVPDALSGDEWRPIGMKRQGNLETYTSSYIFITFRSAERMLRGDGPTAGFAFNDSRELGGSYTLSYRIQRLQ